MSTCRRACCSEDGASVGVAMVAAIVSALTGCMVRCDLAMIGEITLSRQVVPVGGIRENVLAVLRPASRHPPVAEPEACRRARRRPPVRSRHRLRDADQRAAGSGAAAGGPDERHQACDHDDRPDVLTVGGRPARDTGHRLCRQGRSFTEHAAPCPRQGPPVPHARARSLLRDPDDHPARQCSIACIECCRPPRGGRRTTAGHYAAFGRERWMRAEGARYVSGTTRREGSIWRELPASRAFALSASRSGRGSSGQPQQVARADEPRRDPLDAVGRGSPRVRGGTSATHWTESPASPANGALVLSASRSGRGSSGEPQQGLRADEQGRDPLGASGKGPPRARGGTSATHTDEGR